MYIELEEQLDFPTIYGSSKNGWIILEKLVKNFAEKIGFRSEFSYDDHILIHDWTIKKVQKVNLFGLSKLILISNT